MVKKPIEAIFSECIELLIYRKNRPGCQQSYRGKSEAQNVMNNNEPQKKKRSYKNLLAMSQY